MVHAILDSGRSHAGGAAADVVAVDAAAHRDQHSWPCSLAWQHRAAMSFALMCVGGLEVVCPDTMHPSPALHHRSSIGCQ